MIVVQAPLRISFVGGGTDLPAFYKRYPGRVISTSINKYVYVVINRTPLIPKVSARYSQSETVNHASELIHTRIKAALLDYGIFKNIEIASFASLPAQTGLGSSSSFSVALLRGLHAFSGKKTESKKLAEETCRLEIQLVGEPIGKQDQYVATFGGLNVMQFNADETVDVKPVFLGYQERLEFESHLFLFFTGLTRSAANILAKQNKNLNEDETIFQRMKYMSDAVEEFHEALISGAYEVLGSILHRIWLEKKKLNDGISNDIIDQLYDVGKEAGAWGGKLLGAGGGGCLLFIAPPTMHSKIYEMLFEKATALGLTGFQQIPLSFTHCGVQILFNGDYFNQDRYLR